MISLRLAILAQLACVADLTYGLHEALNNYLDPSGESGSGSGSGSGSHFVQSVASAYPDAAPSSAPIQAASPGASIHSSAHASANTSQTSKNGTHYENGAHNRYLNSFLTPMTGDISYKAYKGDGSVDAGWPEQTDWIDFKNMWVVNQQSLINKLCDNTPAETQNLYKAILQVSTTTSVDPRFILAIIMEESHGCVRVQSTSLSVTNPGLMQSYEGKGSCASPTLLKPCPWSEIVQMINDGTAPNSAGVDLKDLLKDSKKKDVSMYYIASRMYNSGKLSVPASGELSVGGANACYAADIANRLRGYVGGSCGDSTGA